MQLKDMINLLGFYIDDVPDNTTAVTLFNTGKDKMATAVGAKFPNIAITPSMEQEFVFDSEYHETPVLYAAAMYKANDSSVSEKRDFLSQFFDGLSEFSENYEPPIQYRNDHLSQHFTATSGQTEFTVTKNGFSPTYGNPKVYINSAETSDYWLSNKTVNLYYGADEGAIISVIWEDSTAYEQPPYPWTKGAGW